MENVQILGFVLTGGCLLLILGVSFLRNLNSGLRRYQIWWGRLFGVKAWHFIGLDHKLRYRDDREVKEGETLSMPGKGKPSLCVRGMHASLKLEDALNWAPGPVLCRVRVWGSLEYDANKLTGKHRKCLRLYPDLGSVFLKAAVEAIKAFPIDYGASSETPAETRLFDMALTNDKEKLMGYLEKGNFNFIDPCPHHKLGAMYLLLDMIRNLGLSRSPEDPYALMKIIRNILDVTKEKGTKAFLESLKASGVR